MNSKWIVTQESEHFVFFAARNSDFRLDDFEDIEGDASMRKIIQVEKFGSCGSDGTWDQMLVVCRKIRAD